MSGLALLPRFDFNGDYVNRLVSEDGPETERHFARKLATSCP